MAYRQPIILLSGNSRRTQGRDAQSMNFAAVKAVAQAVRTTLGPLGMDKMLVDATDGVVITNDGATILDEMDIEHPSAEMIVEVADSQEEEAGDGTTSVVVLAGELLAKSESLIDDVIHSSTMTSGFRRAAAHASTVLEDRAQPVTPTDEATLRRIASTAMTGKGVGGASGLPRGTRRRCRPGHRRRQ